MEALSARTTALLSKLPRNATFPFELVSELMAAVIVSDFSEKTLQHLAQLYGRAYAEVAKLQWKKTLTEPTESNEGREGYKHDTYYVTPIRIRRRNSMLSTNLEETPLGNR